MHLTTLLLPTILATAQLTLAESTTNPNQKPNAIANPLLPSLNKLPIGIAPRPINRGPVKQHPGPIPKIHKPHKKHRKHTKGTPRHKQRPVFGSPRRQGAKKPQFGRKPVPVPVPVATPSVTSASGPSATDHGSKRRDKREAEAVRVSDVMKMERGPPLGVVARPVKKKVRPARKYSAPETGVTTEAVKQDGERGSSGNIRREAEADPEAEAEAEAEFGGWYGEDEFVY